MTVKFLTISAGPAGIIRPGDVVDVSDGEAKLLIDGKYAEPVTVTPAIKPTKKGK